MKYIEPPEWYYSVRESLGEALLSAGDYAQAEQVFREDLRRTPHNGRSLFGLALALRNQHKEDESKAIDMEFHKSWKHADTPLGSKA